MRLLPALLLAFLVSVSAANGQQTTPKAGTTKVKQKAKAKQPAKKAPARKVQAAPVIVFKKTPCFGTCPDYDATIYPDGRVTYVGRTNVKLTGTRELKLPATTVTAILTDAQSLGFRKLQEHYSSGATDMPSTFLSIRQPDGTLKTVQVEDGAPEPLRNLLTYISGELDKISGNAVATDR